MAVTLKPKAGIRRRGLTRGLFSQSTNLEIVGIVAEGDLVGVSRVEDSKTYLHFHPTRVHHECQAFPEMARTGGRRLSGVGRALVAEIVRRSLERGYEGHVSTLTSYQSAVFFEKLGFEVFNEVLRILAGEAVSRYLSKHELLYGSFL